ncbi:hypothetical protein COLO4_33259 [Corchorus olitorius]|uniref:Uncharacterized protein n=1 Tax=Corchorus olitorius TaxID=93759 RepID=A0A1R3GV85_9ROSI|nr:hypothetical protein COLO4_33259 [Corchorus olitorius]
MKLSQVQDIVSYRVAIWCKAKWPHSATTVDEILRLPDSISLAAKEVSNRAQVTWEAPPVGGLIGFLRILIGLLVGVGCFNRGFQLGL